MTDDSKILVPVIGVDGLYFCEYRDDPDAYRTEYFDAIAEIVKLNGGTLETGISDHNSMQHYFTGEMYDKLLGENCEKYFMEGSI